MASDGKQTSLIMQAVDVLVVVVIVGAVLFLMTSGKDLFNSGTKQVSSLSDEFSGGKLSVYDGTTQSGQGVRRIINELFAEENVEVLVCTKDGANLIYNKCNVGKAQATVQSVATGMPEKDAVGKIFGENGGAVLSGAGATMCSSGYNETAKTGTTGYITQTANFKCSVQKDLNGEIRRVTFIQE